MLKRVLLLLLTLLLISHATTTAQTFLKKFIKVNSFAKIGKALVFAADDGSSGMELWTSDGTPVGTTLLKDIYPGIFPSNPASLFAYNGKIYFSANDGVNGTELWCSDGTAAGTVMLKDINTFKAMGSQPAQFTICDGKLYFTASSSGSGNVLWITDGTAAGTISLTINNSSLGISQLTAVGKKIYFTIDGNRALWESDGTVGGTKNVPIDDYYITDLLRNINDELVFITNTSYRSNIRLYKLSPANNSFAMLKSYNSATYGSLDIDNITAVGRGFYYTIRTVDANDKGLDALWKSDMTPNGTTQIQSYNWQSHLSNSSMYGFVSFNNKLFFASNSSHNLWTSDGTLQGTVKISDVVVNQGVRPVILAQKLFFTGNSQLWSFDGSTAKVELSQPANPSSLFEFNDKVSFTINNYYDSDLWTNEENAGMSVVKDYQMIASASNASYNTKVDSALSSNITITNVGKKTLNLSSIDVIGASFYVSGKPNQILAPGSQTSFKLIYYPKQEEIINGVLTIVNNDNSKSTFQLNLTGTAVGKARQKSKLDDGISKSIQFKDDNQSFYLSGNLVSENQPANTNIGLLQIADNANTYTYSLTSGDGDADNAGFVIDNGQLKAANSFNYEVKNTYSIRVKASSGSISIEKIFIISIADVTENTASGNCPTTVENLSFELNDVAYIGNRLVSVGSNGKVIVSDNDGQDWRRIETGYYNSLSSIQATDQQTAYLSGSSNLLLKTQNGGLNWFNINAPKAGNGNFFFYSSLIGYVFGDGGIFKTSDGGKSWKKQISAADYGSVLYSAFFTDENNGFICGSSQTLLRTKNGGETWEKVSMSALGTNSSLNLITFINANTGFIVSSAGDILQTKDGGNSWARTSTISTSGWTAMRIYFVNAKEGYIITPANQYYKTLDGGQTWNLERLSTLGALTGLAFNTDRTKYCLVGHGQSFGSAVGTTGHTIYLKNGNNGWILRSYISDSKFSKIHIEDKTGYVFGTNSYRTLDGGITWKQLTLNNYLGNGVKATFFLNKDVVFYADYNGLYKTNDGGDSWVKINVENLVSFATIHFFDEQKGIVTTGAGAIYKTTNGGLDWKKVYDTSGPFGQIMLRFIDQQTGYLVGNGSKIFKTTDGGDTWAIIDVGNNAFITSIHFFDMQTGLLGGSNGVLLRTTDAGQSWNEVRSTLPISNFVWDFAFLDSLHGYAISTYNSGNAQIYETKDAGLTWFYVSQADRDLYDMTADNDKIYAVGGSGTIFRLNSTQNIVPEAGYIKSESQPQVLSPTTFSVLAAANTNYKWTVTGTNDVIINKNSITVSWKQKGTYSVQVTPSNDCGVGTTSKIDVDVLDVPKPVITSYSKSGTGTATTVVINGDNFFSTTAVGINGTTVTSFVISSPTSITAMLGNAPLGDISVTNPGGTTVFAYKAAPVITAASSLTGVTNTTIEISGSNFNEITDVSFGDVPAKSFVVNSPSSIIAVVGAGASGKITATNNYGIADLNGFVFYSPPTISFVSPTAAGAGSLVYIYGTSFTPSTTVSFGGVNAQNVSVISSTYLTAKVAPGSNSGNIRLTATGGTAQYSGFTFIQPPSLTSAVYAISGSNIIFTITGLNLSNTILVTNGVASATSYIVNSSNSVTATFSGNKIDDITVTTQGGAATLQKAAIVTSTPVLTFAALPSVVYGDSVINLNAVSTLLSKPITYTSSNPGTATITNGKLTIGNAGTSVITVSQSGAADVKQTLTVNPKSIALTAKTSSKTYGDIDPLLDYVISSGSLVGTDKLSGSLSRDAGENVGAYKINQGTLTAGKNYIISYAGTSLTVNPKNLVVTAEDKARMQGKVNPNFSVLYSGFVNGDDPKKLTVQPTVTTTASTGSPAGIYDLVPSGGMADNYAFVYKSGKLTVNTAANNFNVAAVNVSCKGQNNGSINIMPVLSANYTAVLTGSNTSRTISFTSGSTFDNLTPGSYNVCVTDAALPGRPQCFDVVISEPKDLSVYATTDKASGMLTLALAGGSNYNVTLNGTVYKTSASSITVPLQSGSNKLTVTTDQPCQGTFEEFYVQTDKQLPYPNPFQDFIYINLGEQVINKVTVKLYDVSSGAIKINQQFTAQTGVVRLEAAQLGMGVYSMHLTMDGKEKVYKLIKK